MRQKLNSSVSRYREAMSSTARFAVSEYSTDCRKCHGCGAIGNGRSARGSCWSGTNGIVIGVGLPIVSVSRPIWLWKYTVVRRPPFHHVEYVEPLRIVTPGLPSASKRECIAAATRSSSTGMSGSKLKLNGSRKGGANITVPTGPVWWWL